MLLRNIIYFVGWTILLIMCTGIYLSCVGVDSGAYIDKNIEKLVLLSLPSFLMFRIGQHYGLWRAVIIIASLTITLYAPMALIFIMKGWASLLTISKWVLPVLFCISALTRHLWVRGAMNKEAMGEFKEKYKGTWQYKYYSASRIAWIIFSGRAIIPVAIIIVMVVILWLI